MPSPTLRGTRPQPHLCLLISARHNDGHACTPAQHFRRYNRTHPARGGVQKDEAFRHRGALKAHRVLISDMLNVHLEDAGQVARVHPDTLEQRQLHRKPEPKPPPVRAGRTASRGSSVHGCRRCCTSGTSGLRSVPTNSTRPAPLGRKGRSRWASRVTCPCPQSCRRSPRLGRTRETTPPRRRHGSGRLRCGRQPGRGIAPARPCRAGGTWCGRYGSWPRPWRTTRPRGVAACAAPGGGGAGARPDPRLGLLAWPGGHRRPPRGSSGSFQETGKSGRLAGGAAPCAEARRAAVSQGAPV